MKTLLLLGVLLTPQQALDLHCKIACVEDGMDSGRWDQKQKGCMCEFFRIPAMPIDGVLKKEINASPP